MSIVSGTVSGVLGAQAQDDATEANLQNARDTRDMSYRMFGESRGSLGNAFLPTYGGTLERDVLFPDAVNNYYTSRGILGSPVDQYNRYRMGSLKMMPAIEAGDRTVNDIYNGNLTNERLGNFAPVGDARMGVARTQKQGVYEGLSERLNNLAAQNAKKGYSGNGSLAINSALTATIAARQQAAIAEQQARLMNVMDIRGIQDAGQDLRLRSLDLPYQRAQQNISFDLMPLQYVQQNQARMMQPFDPFRLNPGAFEAKDLPTIGAIPSAAQIALTGMGQGNAALGQVLYNKYAYNGGRTGYQSPDSNGVYSTTFGGADYGGSVFPSAAADYSSYGGGAAGGYSGFGV